MNVMAAAPEIERATKLLDRWLTRAAAGRVSFRLWDGTPWPDDAPRAATVVLKHPGALAAMFSAGTEKGLAEAFLADDFEVEGDLEAACELADALAESAAGGWLGAARALWPSRRASRPPAPGRAWSARGLRWPRRHSRGRDREAVTFHYDLSNDFYRLWLDSRMLYSCAYFERPDDDLDRAQTAKLRHLGRKLRLRPGQSLLDVGCGWGGLALFAAAEFGARVTGITLSPQQAALATARVQDAGRAAEVDIQLKDYRELEAPGGFDALVSVGMAEHVGAENLGHYFRRAFDLVKPGGVFLNHAIGDGVRARATPGPSFIQEYVFPDSDIPPLPQVLAAAEAAGFEVRDVENLREHYQLTLRHWVRRLEAARVEARRIVDEATYRTWRLYLAGSARGFGLGRLAVYQTLLAKPDRAGRVDLPLTRRDWYASP